MFLNELDPALAGPFVYFLCSFKFSELGGTVLQFQGIYFLGGSCLFCAGYLDLGRAWGLDMRFCRDFEAGRFLGKSDRPVVTPFGLHSGLRQSGGRVAAFFLDARLKPRCT